MVQGTYFISFNDDYEDFYPKFCDAVDDCGWLDYVTIPEDITDNYACYCMSYVLKTKYQKPRFIVMFKGSLDLYKIFREHISELPVIGISDFSEEFSDDLNERLNQAYNNLDIHIDDFNEYEKDREELRQLIDEDIEIYGEVLLEAFPVLFK